MARPHSEPKTGDVFAEKYRVDRVLGRGGMGVVLAATHVLLGHQVALKFLLPSAAIDDETAARFLREAKVTARLKSAHTAKTLDIGQLEDGRPFLVMELLDGHDLGQEIDSRGALPIAEALDWVLQACEGIAEAHANGIVHRDLKPSNMFLARDVSGGTVLKVLDFGISKLVADTDGALTQSHAAFGSPLYMSPEQLHSSKSADARSDVWSLGVILYEALCGLPPFRGETVFAIAQSVALEMPQPPLALRADLPPALSAAVMRCLAKRPLERPQSVADLADALAPFAGPGGAERAARVRSALGPDAAARRTVVSIVPPAEHSDEWVGATTKRATSRAPAGRRMLTGLLVGAVIGLVAAIGLWLRAPGPRHPVSDPAASTAAPPASVTIDAVEPDAGVTMGAAPVLASASLPTAPPSAARAPAGSAAAASSIRASGKKAQGAGPTPAAPATATASSPSSPFIDQRTN